MLLFTASNGHVGQSSQGGHELAQGYWTLQGSVMAKQLTAWYTYVALPGDT